MESSGLNQVMPEHYTTTGRTIDWRYSGRLLSIYNQRSRLWTHPYDFRTPPASTLYDSGCGIFSVAHAVEWMHGIKIIPEELADFSCAHNGRGDDGTDRPALLSDMMTSGLAQEYGFSYCMDGLRNDNEALWKHLRHKEGTALCNLRAGHIVTLLDARKKDSNKQVLVIDSNSESKDTRIIENVFECDYSSAITCSLYNSSHILVGYEVCYAVYWASLDIVRDFNLLHII
jgi:hypothetical protein